MKKNRLIIVGLFSIMGLSLSACGKNSDASTGAASSEADTTGSSVSTTAQANKKSADDKEDTMKLVKDFLGTTLEDQNHVVTATMDGKDVFNENVSGTCIDPKERLPCEQHTMKAKRASSTAAVRQAE